MNRNSQFDQHPFYNILERIGRPPLPTAVLRIPGKLTPRQQLWIDQFRQKHKHLHPIYECRPDALPAVRTRVI